MSFQLSWTIEGEKQFSRKLRGLQTAVQDFTVPLSNIADNLKSTFSKDVFQSKGAVIGERWKPLSPYTLATKARRGLSSAPLVATGAMQGGFKSIVTQDYAVISNTQDYFKYHQSNRPRKKLPRRVMMKIANKQREMIQKEFQLYIIKAAK